LALTKFHNFVNNLAGKPTDKPKERHRPSVLLRGDKKKSENHQEHYTISKTMINTMKTTAVMMITVELKYSHPPSFAINVVP